MSRGPGRVERLIEETFRGNPDRTFTTDELVALAYPGVNRIEKKHRVAVLRAAYAAARRSWWAAGRSSAKPHRMIFGYRLDLRAYDLWHRQVHSGVTAEEAAARMDDPSHPSFLPPDHTGFLSLWVDLAKAEAEGDPDRAEAIRQKMDALRKSTRLG